MSDRRAEARSIAASLRRSAEAMAAFGEPAPSPIALALSESPAKLARVEGPRQNFALAAPPPTAARTPAARPKRDGAAVPSPSTILPAPQHPSLDALHAAIKDCVKCPLGKTRTKFVFGEGSPRAKIVFIGEAPGEQEDLTGRPFVGRAGQLLDKLLADVGLARSEVFICNTLKCRPPGNRTPLPSEIAECEPHLFQQLALLNPRVVVCLGAPAAQTILRTKKPIGGLRGQLFHAFGIPVLPTYHPAFLLRPNGQPSIPTVRADLQLAIAQSAKRG